MLIFLVLLLLWSSLGAVLAWTVGVSWWDGVVGGSVLLLVALAAASLGLRRGLQKQKVPRKYASGLEKLAAETGARLVWVDSSRPFVCSLGWGATAAVSRGLLEELPQESALLIQYALRCGVGLKGAVLTGAMAMPAGLRGIQAGLRAYRKARGHPGPTDLIASALAQVARFLEAAAVFGRRRFVEVDRGFDPDQLGAALRGLLERTADSTRGLPWMQSLSPLAPIAWDEVEDLDRLAAVEGLSLPEALDRAKPASGHWTSSHPDLRLRLALLRGERPPRGVVSALLALLGPLAVSVGLVLAALPGGLLAAPILLGGAAWVFEILVRFPVSRPQREGLGESWRNVRVAWRGRPVHLEGQLQKRCRPGSSEGWYLRDGGSSVLLEFPHGGVVGDQEKELDVDGWLVGCPPRLVVGRIRREGRTRRLFPLLRRLAAPVAALWAGGAWASLQWMGL